MSNNLLKIILFIYFLPGSIAYAYMDPASIAFIYKIFIAFFAGLIIFLKNLRNKIKNFFLKIFTKKK